jgi:hypothetical protein
MTIKRLSETLSFNDDDKDIIATMKKVGVWREMKRIAKIGGGDKTIVCSDYIFQWNSRAGDSGYTAFHSTNPLELAELFAKIGELTGGGSTSTSRNGSLKLSQQNLYGA